MGIRINLHTGTCGRQQSTHASSLTAVSCITYPVQSCDSQSVRANKCVIGCTGLCPGCDNEEEPIGCLVLDVLALTGCDPPMDSFIPKGGTVCMRRPPEVQNIKYPWLRAGEAFLVST